MPYNKTIVCLANSYKTNGRCVAGREILASGFAGWIRPVSARETGEVSFSESRYQNNRIPELLDIVEIPFLRPHPLHHQVENHVIDAARRWEKKGKLPWISLESICDRPRDLWINSDSTFRGRYDRTTLAEAITGGGSLMLVKPENFTIDVGKNDWTGSASFRGVFLYNGTLYNLGLTDPVARDLFSNRPAGTYPLSEAYFCLSLTEPFESDKKCYKLVAAVISRELSLCQ